MTHQLSPEMRHCIDECLRCYSVCLSMAMNHCLEVGGEHVAPQHFRLMMACAEICRTAAHFMLIGSEHHRHTCAECAATRTVASSGADVELTARSSQVGHDQRCRA